MSRQPSLELPAITVPAINAELRDSRSEIRLQLPERQTPRDTLRRPSTGAPSLQQRQQAGALWRSPGQVHDQLLACTVCRALTGWMYAADTEAGRIQLNVLWGMLGLSPFLPTMPHSRA